MVRIAAVLAALFVGGFFILDPAASMAAFPDKPVHFIVGFPPGGGTDVMARLLAQKLSEKWGQPVVVENRSGADGTIAEDYITHSPADGYILSVTNNNHTLTPTQYKLNYDPIKDFAPVVLVAESTEVMVANHDLPVKTLADFIALAKTKPGAMNLGSSGGGTATTMSHFQYLTGTKLTTIDYKGNNPVVVAVLGGEVQVALGVVATYAELIATGKVTPLAVTSSKRFPLLPNVPSFHESSGFEDFHGGSWLGVLAPAKTPRDVIIKLNNDIADVTKMKDVTDSMLKQAYVPVLGDPEAFGTYIDREMKGRAEMQKILGTIK